jgi:hypothetical protein
MSTIYYSDNARPDGYKGRRRRPSFFARRRRDEPAEARLALFDNPNVVDTDVIELPPLAAAA